MKGLTVQQEKFCQEIVKGTSQRQAYIKAYPNSAKWKPENVDSKASNLKARDKVKARIRELRKKSKEKGEDEAFNVRKKLIDEYNKIIDADIGDFYHTFLGEDGNVYWEVNEIEKVPTKVIKKISFTKFGVNIELHDKLTAMKALSDLYGLNESKVDSELKIVVDGEFKGMDK